MALAQRLSNLAANAEANALAALFDVGSFFEIRSGTQPATADTAPADGAVLATILFGTPAFGAAVAGLITANAIADGVIAIAGVASWVRCKTSGSATIIDGSVGSALCNLLVNSTAFTTLGAAIRVTSFTLTARKS